VQAFPLMLGLVIAIVLAALAYAFCSALGLPSLVALVAAILVLIAAAPSGAWGLGGRLGGRARS
jgi:hypothetical protein